MLLYLVQHGDAKKEDDDPLRGLTDKGFRDVALVALYAQEQNVKVNGIYHSGKKRALQTAQIFSDYLKPAKGIFQAEGLAPADDPGTWASRLAGITEDSMLVGHLPFLAKLTGLLLCHDKDKMFVDFKMGCLVCLMRSDDGLWAIEWMVIPEMVR